MLNTLVEQRFTPISADQQLVISDRVCAMRYEISERPNEPPRRLLGCHVGSVSLVRYEGRGVERGSRTMEHIRNEGQDYFLLCIPLQARFRFAHVGRITDLGHGAAVLLSAQHPFDAYVQGESADNSHSSLEVRIPGSLLRSRLLEADLVCNRAFSVCSGAGHILQDVLLATLHEGQALSAVQALRQGQVMIDLVANALLGMVERHTGKESLAVHSAFDRAMVFIESHLSDTALDAQEIARHCRISARYLHKIFRQHSLTVAGCVREMRLQRCQQALRNPRLLHRPVIEIAGHWGFSDPSHFGRLYKKRFGVSPSEERHQHLRKAGSH